MNNHKLNKLTSIPLLNLHFLQGRRSRELAQPSTSELNHPSIHGRRSRALARVLPTLNGRWYSSSQKPAFTIIEVVLVLAIAGLIFLMVFIALPALQRNQRDQQRKQDLNRALSALESYRGNNRGRLPVFNHAALNVSFADNYLRANGEYFRDPSGRNYYFHGHIHQLNEPITAIDSGVTEGVTASTRSIHVHVSAVCDGNMFVEANSPNKFATAIVLEGGGVYCVNN